MILAARLIVAALLLAGCQGAPATPAPSSPAASLPTALAAGDHASTMFQPRASFTLPDGWWIAEDSPDYLAIQPVSSNVVGVHLFRDAGPASQELSCPTAPEPGVGATSGELAAWIRGLDGLEVSRPRMASVGGLRGVELDVAIAPDWTASCPFANGIPTVPLFVGQDRGLRWVVAGSERLRLAILDVPGGGTVVVDIDAFDGSLMDGLLEAATPIVRSLDFAS